jgi:predicted secreted protein
MRFSVDQGGGSYNNLGNEVSVNMSLDIAPADSTNKDSNNWNESIQTIRSMTVTFNGWVDESDQAFSDLQDAFFNNTQPSCRVTSPDGTTYTATMSLGNLTFDGPHDNVYGLSGSVVSDGAVTKA